jgi:hypothetical protein
MFLMEQYYWQRPIPVQCTGKSQKVDCSKKHELPIGSIKTKIHQNSRDHGKVM